MLVFCATETCCMTRPCSTYHSRSAMPMYWTINFSWCGKSTLVAYSVSRPMAKPIMTHLPLLISFSGVHPNTLHHNGNLSAPGVTDDAVALACILGVLDLFLEPHFLEVLS
jgi:hypothetical protein